jgi:hypothetical protein
MATPSNGYAGYLERSTTAGSSDTYEKVALIREVTLPRSTREAIDVTHTEHSGYVEFIPSSLNAIEDVEFTVMYDPDDAVHAKLSTDATTTHTYQNSHFWRWCRDDGTVRWECQGFVIDIGEEIERDEVITLTFTLKLTGAPTTIHN